MPEEKSPNQQRLEDLHWILCKEDGREELRKWIRDSVRSVVSEAAVLDRIALAVLKRDCDLIDPTAKTKNVTGTTTLARMVNWRAYNFEEARQDNASLRGEVEALGKEVAALVKLLTPAAETTEEAK